MKKKVDCRLIEIENYERKQVFRETKNFENSIDEFELKKRFLKLINNNF